MHWDDLRIFLAVARAESLSQAGRVLKIDPATVARRVARLEEATGSVLFVKSPQGYALTQDGERLERHATRAELSVTAGVEDLRGQDGQMSGTIRIGAPDGSANYLLPQVCAGICEENPDLDVQIVALPRVFNLSKREADMALTVSPPIAGRLLVQKVTDYHLHLAATDSYLASHEPINCLADLSRHRIIGYIPDLIFDKELDYMDALKTKRIALSSNSFSVQFNAVLQGAGVAIVHDFAIPFAPGMRRILTDALSLTRSFYLVRHTDDRRLERLNRFAARLVKGVRAEVIRLQSLA